MPRHRAPSPSRPSITVVLAGAALGTSVLLPGTALGRTAASTADRTGTGLSASMTEHPGTEVDEPRGTDGDDADRAGDHADRPRTGVPRPARHHSARPRPMTSGERQYRNGCRQGYILDGCEQFDVRHLLRRGIDPLT